MQIAPFAYPDKPHARKHGPQGYLEYQSYKPWLRDEFTFRCVYCLMRERWFPNGQDSFSADHVQPQSLAPALICSYDNLVYACLRCNSCKANFLLPDPGQEPFGQYLRVLEDGTIEGITDTGNQMIEQLKLNDPRPKEFRQRLLATLRKLSQSRQGKAILQAYLGFPDDLPELSSLRPPEGNSRRAGLEQSYFAQKRRGELPQAY